ncbi:MAG: phosphoribosylformylglycinamidine synthase subunit PurL [Thaumarchaeota archaeon]|nr:phosphoribosylformylglycinamidine synthase subunit PurL [Nitrososphaerota archaeon]MCL5318296.1 phosphoribosylformylglycinamidine synthase subunit PurL [Nitrososphaerota archaeon]
MTRNEDPELQLGLTEEEKRTLRKRLGREPNALEWAMVDAEWSEHCSYKSSKPVLKQLPTKGRYVLLGPGFDAGAIDVGDGYVVTLHIESHNHPSAIDPYGGSATGIGGVIRDILSIGTRPIALLDSLRFGDIRSSANSRWLFKNVVRGISDYGNCIGVPTVGGEVGFDPSFEKNCLVDVVCIGLGKKENMVLAEARNAGDSLILMGGSTGRDGIHGVTFASKVLSDESENERSAVQIPSPFVKKLIIEATLEAVATGHVKGLKDLGGGGLTCGISEMAREGSRGIDVDVSRIPLRESDMTAVETLISESQERMLFVVEHGYEEEIEKIFDKYDILYANIGTVTEKDALVIKKGKAVLADMPVETVTEAPIIQRAAVKPRHIDALRKVAPPKQPVNLSETLLTLLTSPTIASKRWIYEQYDHEVGVRTVVKPGQSGASVLRLDNGKLLATTVDGNPKHCYLDPYHGAAGGLAEACRNIISVGGEPAAMLDHCQFGDPGDPEVFWTFSESVRGMSDYGKELGLPCVGGKVSFYNEDVAAGSAIKPSPIVAVVGLIEDASHIRRASPRNEDDRIVILGITKPEMGGSEYYEYVHQLTGGEAPKVDFAAEKKLWKTVLEGIRKGLIDAANDCSEGGLAVTLAEMAIAGGRGLQIDVGAAPSTCKRLDDLLFSESHGRIVVSVNEKHVKSLVELIERNGVPCGVIGAVKGNALIIKSGGREVVSLPLKSVRESWSGAIPGYMGEKKQ